MKMLFPIITAVCISVVSAKWEECHLPRSGLPTGRFPKEFAISGCSLDDARCLIRRSNPIKASATFVTLNDVTDLTPKVTAHALGQVVHYELEKELLDGCSQLVDARCPLDENSSVRYEFVFNVGKEYPLIDLNIEFRLFDQDDNMQFCADVNARVTD